MSTCSRGIQPIPQKHEDAIESAKSAAAALKRRLNLGFGRRVLCPTIWVQWVWKSGFKKKAEKSDKGDQESNAQWTDEDWLDWWENEAG